MALPIWINPFHRPADRAEAFRMGRVGAVGVAINAAAGVGAGFLFWFQREAFADFMRSAMEIEVARRPMSTPEAEAMSQAMTDWMAGIMPPLIAGMSVVFALVYVLLAWLQWRRPNRIIPGILLALFVWSLLSTVINLGRMPEMAGLLGWWTAIMWPVSIFAAVLLAVGFRGAAALYRFDRTPPAASAG
jgi:hypothetical protein